MTEVPAVVWVWLESGVPRASLTPIAGAVEYRRVEKAKCTCIPLNHLHRFFCPLYKDPYA
jgi:hypothetical protein